MKHLGVKKKELDVILNKEADKTLLHSLPKLN